MAATRPTQQYLGQQKKPFGKQADNQLPGAVRGSGLRQMSLNGDTKFGCFEKRSNKTES
jgi:hypothetical protein